MLRGVTVRVAQGAGAKQYRGRLASDGNAARDVLWAREARGIACPEH